MADTSGEPFQTSYEGLPIMENYQEYAMLRFGHEDNIEVLFDGDANTSDQSDYVLGLIFVGAVIIGFFAIWSICLMIAMCMGQKVGFLSGAPFMRKPPRGSSTDQSSQHYEDDDLVQDEDRPSSPAQEQPYDTNYGLGENSSFPEPPSTAKRGGDGYYAGDPLRSRASLCRLCFIFSGLTCIAFGLLMVTHGITNLQTSIDTVDKNANDLEALTRSARTVIREGLRNQRPAALALRTVVQTELRDDVFCPADPDVSGNSVGSEIKRNKDAVVALLDDLDDFADGDLADLEDAMRVLEDASSTVTDESDTYSVNDWESLIVLIPYTLFPSLLIVAALMAFHDVSLNHYNCFINWFVLPIFIVMTVVAFTFAGAMAVAAGANSDFCLPGGMSDGSPDDNVLAIMEARGHEETSFPYRVAQFYIKQCSADNPDPLLDIRNYEPQLNSNLASIDDLLTQIRNESRIDELAVYCNREFDVVEPLLESMQDIIKVLLESLRRTLDLAKCGRIIPLYTDTIYEAGCQYSPTAVFWIFSCSLILGFFGMVMITLRSSMKMTVIDYDYAGHYPAQEDSESFRHHQDEADEDVVEEVEPNPDNLREEDEDEHEEEEDDTPAMTYTKSEEDSGENVQSDEYGQTQTQYGSVVDQSEEVVYGGAAQQTN